MTYDQADALFIYGTGGHAKVVVDAAGGSERVAGFVDDNAETSSTFMGRPVVKLADLPRGAMVQIAIGDSHVRERLSREVSKLGFALTTVIHPRAIVSQYAAIASGSFIAAGAIAAPFATIGSGTILNHGCVVDHDCTIGDWCHIAPNATLGGGVTIGKHVLIGANAAVLPLSRIADQCNIGAGAAVTRNIDEAGSFAGVPARKL